MIAPLPLLLRFLVLAIAVSVVAPTVEARDLRVVGNALTKKLAVDRQRDAATKAVPLAKPKTVHRYTSVERARRESRHGLEPGVHMTANARRGPPLTAENAKQRYGLPATPSARETIRLPANTPVRPNKVLGGSPGYGEITSPARIPPAAVLRVDRVRPAGASTGK
jgi:hypothetical protein